MAKLEKKGWVADKSCGTRAGLTSSITAGRLSVWLVFGTMVGAS